MTERDEGRGPAAGPAGMVDIGGKPMSHREAVARGHLSLRHETIRAIEEGTVKKGDPLDVARVAAMLAVKDTPRLVPHCHQLPITRISVEFSLFEEGVEVELLVETDSKTGVEVEAIVGVSMALCTIWDMVKYLEKDEHGQYPTTRIDAIEVVRKLKEEI